MTLSQFINVLKVGFLFSYLAPLLIVLTTTLIKEFFDETKANVVTDIANGGRSSRLFYNEDSRWPEVKRRIEANNKTGKKSVVILSFGHNDQRALTDCDKTYGAQFTFASENANGTVAGTHYDFMEKYIVETLE